MGGAAEVQVDEALVRALLGEQHPDLASSRLTKVAEGWDNVIFRSGADLTVRLPRRVEGAALVTHEHQWLSGLVAGLPHPGDGGLATSAPLRTGRPGCGYPWSWSVGPWLPGTDAATTAPTDGADAARRLGTFLAAFHRPAPRDAPANPYRGIPLADRSARLMAALDEVAELGRDLGPGVSRAAVEDRWAALVATPAWDGPPLWLHGDLHPANLLVHRGRLSAVIDFGDLTSGDPATDLGVAWLLLPSPARPVFRSAAGHGHGVSERGIDDDTWTRAQGWALALSVAYLAGASDGSPLIAIGRRTLAELAVGRR